MNAIKLEAHLVTIANNMVDVIGGAWYDVVSSADAKAKAAAMNVGVDTFTAVLEYRVTRTGSGVYGDVTIHDPSDFVRNIEKTLVLVQP